MLILNKRLALERMVSLSERLHEAVPEPFSVLATASFMAMAMPALPAAVRERRSPLLTPGSGSAERDVSGVAAAVR